MAKQIVRLTVNLDPGTREQLDYLADQWDTTVTAALHRAIATATLLQQRIDKGGRILFQDRSDRIQEVDFTES